MQAQSCNDVLMIKPARFAYNPDTATTNTFQKNIDHAASHIAARAQQEFDDWVNLLQQAGIKVHTFADTAEPHTPDAVFPNNWVSFHTDGTVVLYPMLAPNRRLERRLDILAALSTQHHFHIARTIDLHTHESHDKFLEGTGSLVLDHQYRLAYACLSPRTHLDVIGEFAQRLNYQPVVFTACDADKPIYHTNVLMCIGTDFAVVCSDAIETHAQTGVLNKLRATKHTLIEISLPQMRAFAGNMLELRNAQGEPLIALSRNAFNALEPQQLSHLRAHGTLLVANIPTIEHCGGGSVRCMLAEIFLPRKVTHAALQQSS